MGLYWLDCSVVIGYRYLLLVLQEGKSNYKSFHFSCTACNRSLFAASPRPASLPTECEFGPGTIAGALETASPSAGAASPGVAASQRGLKRGLAERERTVLLMLDETIIC